MSQIPVVHFDKVVIKFLSGRKLTLRNVGMIYNNISQFIHEDSKITEINISIIKYTDKWPSKRECYYDSDLHKIVFGEITDPMPMNLPMIFNTNMKDEPVRH